MTVFDITEVLENADATEGRGPMIHHSYFANRIDAEKICNNPWFESRPVKLIIFDSVEEYKNENLKKLREYALNKLTAAEKAALGLQ